MLDVNSQADDNMKLRVNEVARASSFKTVKRPVVKKRNENKQFRLFSSSAGQRQDKLTLETLQLLSPFQNGVDKVTMAAREILINRIQTNPVTHKLFFPEVVPDLRLKEDFQGFPIEKLAVAMCAEAISKCDDIYKFCATVEKQNLENVLQDIYDSVHWKKLGFYLYTELYASVVRDAKLNISIQDYIDDDGPEWAERLIEKMTEPEWTMRWVQKIVRGQVTEDEYNMEMNELFVKLHLLDPQSVIPTFHLLNNIKALPECNLELATRNYLGGRLDCTPLMDGIRTAFAKPTHPVNVSKVSLSDVEIIYGVDVEEFILSEVRDLSVWNGRRPDNRKQSSAGDRCSIM